MDAIIDIVIISYNTRRLLMRCIRSIAAFTPLPYRIIVVDNASTDGSVQAVQGLGIEGIEVIANLRNHGYATACNQGIRVGTSPYILLLNSDVMVMEGWLAPLIACMESDPRIAVVGPKTVDLHGRITGAGITGRIADHQPRGFLEPDRPGVYDTQEDCFSVCGAAYMIRRTLIPMLGMFDTNYFFYFEETDYSVTAHVKGYRVVYCPASRVIHLVGQSNHNHAQLRAYFEQSQRYFETKWAHLWDTDF